MTFWWECLRTRPPQVVIEASLTDSSGYIPVHPQTLEVLTDVENLKTDYTGVYAIGDVTTITLLNMMPLPKAGVFAEAEARVVAQSIEASIAGKPGTLGFDGRGACHVDIGGGLAAFAGGKMLESAPESAIFWVMIASFAALFAVCIVLPDTRVEAEPVRMSGVWHLFAHPLFALFMLCSALLQTSHLVVYNYGTLHWRAAGVSDGMIGLLWAIGVTAEVVLFAVGARFVSRMGPGRLFALAAVAGILRWTILAYSTALPVLFVVQTLHAFTFGAAHLAAMAFIANAIPARLSATAQSLHGSVALSVASGVTAPFLGYLFEDYGGGAFHAMTLFSLAGGACALILMRRWDGRKIVE